MHLKSGTFYFLLKFGCHCVTSTFTKGNIYLVICTFTLSTEIQYFLHHWNWLWLRKNLKVGLFV